MNKFLLLLILFLSACSDNTRLKDALEMSGSNRAELEKVLSHYSKNKADSLKLRAAKFLIENMPGHYTYGGEYMDSYIKEFDSLNPNPIICQKSYFYSLPLKESKIIDISKKKYDIENITSEFLIKNIDFKFKSLENTSWGRDVNFNDFCEYLLPYRIEDEPIVDIKQDTLNDIINRLHTKFIKSKYSDNLILNSADISENIINLGDFNIIFPINKKYQSNIWDCDAVSCITMEKNRLMGIPTMIDFAPHWANANGRHSWCNVIDISKKNARMNYIERSKLAKVYRKTYSHNKSPEIDNNFIPYLFSTFIKDVTDEYVYTANISIPYKECVKTNTKNVYLSVFNELQWQPIAWSELDKKGNANFNSLGKGIVYIPIYYEGMDEIVADYPFILNNNGSVNKLIPNHNDKIKLYIDRKSPIESYKIKWNRNFIGAVIEASNNINFTNADTVKVIRELTHNSLYNIPVDTVKSYRYVRIVSKHKNAQMFLSELSYNDINGNRINGELFIQSKLGEKNSEYNGTKQDQLEINLFDKKYVNFVTIYNWIAIDLKKQTKISSIDIGLRSDGNYIYPKDIYELLYHDETKWVSLEIKKADSFFIEFDNVPSGALYWIRNLTEGREERIFTYENGNMKFW